MYESPANKGAALSLLGRRLGIKKGRNMVCGDSYNDLCLFKAAGIKVAMGNAVPALKEQADYISASYDEDGVAQAIGLFCFDIERGKWDKEGI